MDSFIGIDADVFKLDNGCKPFIFNFENVDWIETNFMQVNAPY